MFSWYNFTNYKTTQQTCIFIYILHTHKKQAHYCAHLHFHFEISLKQMIITLLLYFFAFCHKRKLLLLNMHLISYYVIYCFSALYSAYHQKKKMSSRAEVSKKCLVDSGDGDEETSIFSSILHIIISYQHSSRLPCTFSWKLIMAILSCPVLRSVAF